MSFLSDIFGGTKKNQTQQSQEVTTRNVDAFRTMHVPSATDLQVQLTRAWLAGQLTAQQAQEIQQQRTEMEGLKVDPELEEAQYKSLAQLQALSQSGLDDIDRGKIIEIYDNMTQTARANREANAAKAKAQGTYGSGLAYLDQQMADQDASQQANRFQAQVAADAAERKNQAIKDAASLASGIRQQSFDEQARIAESQDIINQFNAKQRADTQNQNIQNRLATDRANLEAAQAVANKNTDIANQQTLYNSAAQQQAFANEMERNKAIAEGRVTTTGTNLSSGKETSGKDTANALGSLASLVGSWYKSDERNKEDIERTDSDDIDDFIDHITGYKYNYKAGVDRPGRTMGVMAQDLERAPESRAIVMDTPKGKMVDGGKLAGIAMAVVSDLNRRVRELEGQK